MTQSPRVVLVTGANRGIGREVVRHSARHGDRVFLGSRDAEAGQRAAGDIAAALPSGTGTVEAVQLDVTNADDLAQLAGRLRDNPGHLDVLVNNAAINYDTWENSANADLGVVGEALQTNLIGAWRTTLALLPLLRHSAHGRIVMVSSEAGSMASMGGGGAPAYSVSKAALNALTLNLAGDLRGTGILVNAVCPGWVATDMGGAGGRPLEQGAASVAFAMDLPDGGPSGTFTRDGRPIPW